MSRSIASRASSGTCKGCDKQNVDLSHKSWDDGHELHTEQARLFGLCLKCLTADAAKKKKELDANARKTTPDHFPDTRKKSGASPEVERNQLLAWLQKELKRIRIGSGRLMLLMDENRSLSASFMEFQGGLQHVDIDLERDDYMRLFKAVDIGGDRSVTVKEMHHVLYETEYPPECLVVPGKTSMEVRSRRGRGGRGRGGGRQCESGGRGWRRSFLVSA